MELSSLNEVRLIVLLQETNNFDVTFAHKPCDSRPLFTLRCSTAEWWINKNPISHRLWAQIGWAWRPQTQKNWAWQESWDRSVSKTGKIYEKLYYRRYGRIWKSWCRDVVPPVTDAFRLWLSGEHCRLGSWRWRTTKNAGFTTVCARSRGL